MPLCTLEIPVSGSYISDVQAEVVCKKSLGLIKDGLDVPESDLEYRVVMSEKNTRPSLLVSYTVGTDEYGRGTIFKPSDEVMLKTARSIKSDSLISELGIGSVSLEAWENTTFIARSDVRVPTPEVIFKDRRPEEVGKVRVKMALSPEKMGQASFSKESERSSEKQDFDTAASETLGLIKETLKLSDEHDVQIEILPLLVAQTDISLEVDFPSISKLLLPEEREFLARSIEQNVLDINASTKEGSASIWVRQGQPNSVQN